MKKSFFLFVFFFISLTSILFPVTTHAVAPYGNYLDLSGGYVQATSPFTNSPSAFTFEAWIKPNSTSGLQNILTIGNGNPHYGVGINGGSLSLTFHSSPNSQTIITAGHLGANTWQHIGVSISSQSAKLFVNGVQAISISGVASLFPIGDTITLGNGFKGAIDEVRISDNSRNIATLWQNGAYNAPLVSDSDTLLLWHLDGVRGATIAIDSSGNDISGDFIGNDSQIHYFGILPSPTPFALPTIHFRLVLPTISFPSLFFPPSPTPTFSPPQSSTPTPTPFSFFIRFPTLFPRRGV